MKKLLLILVLICGSAGLTMTTAYGQRTVLASGDTAVYNDSTGRWQIKGHGPVPPLTRPDTVNHQVVFIPPLWRDDTTGNHWSYVTPTELRTAIAGINTVGITRAVLIDSLAGYVPLWLANILYQPAGDYVVTAVMNDSLGNYVPLWLANMLYQPVGDYVVTAVMNDSLRNYVPLWLWATLGSNAFTSNTLDTGGLSFRINQRVKYADTAGMLSVYLPKWLASATYMPITDSNAYGTGYISKAFYYAHLPTTLDTGGLSFRINAKVSKSDSNTYTGYLSKAWFYANIPTSLPPSGAAGGDLTGTYPNPTLSSSFPRILAIQTPTFVLTGGSAGVETNLVTLTIPANTIAAGHMIRISVYWVFVGVSGNKTLTIRLDNSASGVTGTAYPIAVVSTASNLGYRSFSEIWFPTASTQSGFSAFILGGTTAAIATSSLAVNAPIYVKLDCALATTSDHAQVQGVLIEYF